MAISTSAKLVFRNTVQSSDKKRKRVKSEKKGSGTVAEWQQATDKM